MDKIKIKRKLRQQKQKEKKFFKYYYYINRKKLKEEGKYEYKQENNVIYIPKSIFLIYIS